MSNLRFIAPGKQLTQSLFSTNASMNIYELTTAVAGQTIVNVNAPFAAGTHQLEVYRNGSFQTYGVDFTETAQNTIQFLTPLYANDSILVTAKGVYSERLHEEYTAQAGQTVFSLQGQYHVGFMTLMIFVNGQLQQNTVDYHETDMQTVTFTYSFVGGETVIFHEQL